MNMSEKILIATFLVCFIHWLSYWSMCMIEKSKRINEKENSMSKDYFIGIEAEGPFKGRKTLFIASDKASPESIYNYLMEHEQIQNVYFGAGDTYTLPKKYEELVCILSEKDKWDIIIEVDKTEKIISLLSDMERVHYIYTIKDDCPGDAWLLKFEGKLFVTVSQKLSDRTVNKRNDFLYDLDKEVYLE